ncbi:MAG: hypothetical protein HY714_01170 [Candidatus Omnitrophica bacterium]|nr:hypothetical protein [Candidatus Omnitrophota bacterium]
MRIHLRGGFGAVLLTVGILCFASLNANADEIAISETKEITESQPQPSAQNAAPSSAQATQNLKEKYFGDFPGASPDLFVVAPSITHYYVKGDRGRFREDWYTDDQTTGGVRGLYFKDASGDITTEFKGKALVNYSYLADMRVSKEGGYYLDARWKRFRKYWNGTEDKPWDPSQYRLPDEFGDWTDEDLYTDRGNVDVELGYPVSETSKLIFKYGLWTREGRETLLKGDVATRTGLPSLRSISMRRQVDGVSNKFTLSLPMKVAEKHNIEPLISYEAYQDGQFTDSTRYTNGVLAQKRDYIDRYQFHDIKLQTKYDSFWSDDVYVHGGYFFNFLRNDSVRSEVRPNLANPNIYWSPDVDNWRVSNTVSAGSAMLDFLRRKGLDMRFGFRGEHAVTDNHGTLIAGGINNLRSSDTNLSEGWFGEALSVTYRRQGTTAYAGIDLEQRRLNWKETFDARNHEIFTDAGWGSGAPELSYETNVTYLDYVPKVKIAQRLNSRMKANLQYKWQQRERQYNTRSDTLPRYYPGYLGDQERMVQEITANLDVKLPAAWISTLKYQWIMDNIEFPKVGDQQQNLDRDRFSMAFSGPVIRNLFGYFAGMYDYYRVDTPTDATGRSNWSGGTGAYDFNGDVYYLVSNLNYRLTKKSVLSTGYQLTDSLGDNRNTMNEVTAGIQYDISKTCSFEARYQIFKFYDGRGFSGYNDEYFGQGVTVGFKKAFE